MNSHEKKLEKFLEKPDKDLLMTIEISPHAPNADLANAILQYNLKKDIVKLRKTIEKSNKTTKKYNKKLVTLTWIIAGLTFLMLVGLGVQIWLNLK